MLPFEFLRTGDRLGRAVLKIERADGSCGTGFLVAPDVVLTNHHVLPTKPIAARAMARANYEANPSDDQRGLPGTVRLDPSRLFLSNPELDVTFCGVGGLEHLGHIALDRDSRSIAVGQPVSIIQHPRGRMKRVALQANRVMAADHVLIQYSCGTEPGSSGSPVFNDTWGLVGVHHASVLAAAESLPLPSAALVEGTPYLNEGVRIPAIAIWLESLSGATTGPSGYLRSLLTGTDPLLGFFGGLGHTHSSGSAADLVNSTYRDRGHRLDMAHWCPTAAELTTSERMSDIVRRMAMLNCDLWFLEGLPPASARRLAEQLRAEWQLDYRVRSQQSCQGPPSSQLIRRSRHFSLDLIDGRPDRPAHLLVRTSPERPGDRLCRIKLLHRDSTAQDLEAVSRAVREDDANTWFVLGDVLVRDAPSGWRAVLQEHPQSLAAETGAFACLLKPPAGSRPCPLYISPNLAIKQDNLLQARTVSDRALPSLGGDPGVTPLTLFRLITTP